jgi:enolase-phosphatase E1
VYDVMFPYVRRELRDYLQAHWHDFDMDRARHLLAIDAGQESFQRWCRTQRIEPTDEPAAQGLVCNEVLRLMDGDVKATGLKYLQGRIWRAGFEGGEMQAHVYADVPPALRAWHANSIDLRVYSSGSVDAQLLFFGHTIAGDLLSLFSGHYDTTVGSKKEAASYRQIAEDFDLPAEQLLFLSDIPAELDAARAAGLQTGLCRRPENAPVESGGHAELRSFDEILLTGHA